MTDLKDFKPNDTVYVWRENNNFRGWSGPGVVVAISENNRSLWVSLRGYLLKVSKEHLRRATSEESLGVELIKVLSAEMLEGLESGNIRHYRDLEEEATAFARERDQQEEVQVQVRPRRQRLPPVREEVDEDIADLFDSNDGGNDDQRSNMEVDQPQAQPAQPHAQPRRDVFRTSTPKFREAHAVPVFQCGEPTMAYSKIQHDPLRGLRPGRRSRMARGGVKTESVAPGT